MSNRLNPKMGVIALISRAGLSSFVAGAGLTKVATLTGLAVASAVAVHAQSNTQGYVYGQVQGMDLAGLTVHAESADTGLSRSAALDARGAYQLSSLPTGTYTVTLRRGGADVDSRQGVVVSVGTGTPVRFVAGASQDVLEMARFEVSGASISPIDVSQTASVTVFREETIDILPVARNITDVMLLSPGTVQGDSAFGNLASVSGSSVAENAYYVNGFNMTNFRNGTSFGFAPFEFLSEVQINSGGYSAEYGRSTGGVTTAVTKRGGNTWKSGVSVYYEPGSLRARAPSVVLSDGTTALNNMEDYEQTVNTNVYLSGPILKDKLFFYALFNGRDTTQEFAVGDTNFYDRTSSDPFWGVKIDYQITDDHLFEYTGFSDKRSTEQFIRPYNSTTGVIGPRAGASYLNRGGKNDIFRYTGTFLDDVLTVSALYGKGEASFTDAGAGDAFRYILDGRTNPNGVLVSQATSLQPGTSEDEREAMRLDGTVRLWGNTLRFGFDRETTTSVDFLKYSGDGIYWRYYATTGGASLPNGGVTPAGTTQYVRERFYSNGGSFETVTDAYYIEDTIKLFDDRLVFTAGLRNEGFDNKNANNETFNKIDDQLAPRIAAAYDVRGDGRSKLFANYGRYYLPIASNTNIRLAGAELFYEDYFVLNGTNADNSPIKGAQIGGRNTFSNGDIKDPRMIVNQNLDPMYQDEFILGYQTQVGRDWKVGIKGTYRDLKSTLEDVAIDAALLKYAAAKGYNNFEAGGFDYYVLTNPGKDMTIYVNLDEDHDGDGIVDSHDQTGVTLEKIDLSAADLGYPKSTRTYYAIELSAERVWNQKWMANFSYTWSQSYGNNEGYVRSDNGQDDAGLTTLFDQPGLTDYSSGFLPNDRRHVFKTFGAYKLTDEIQFGGNFLLQSGKPVNAFGIHPTDAFAAEYGSEAFFANGVPAPRGSFGRTSWTYKLDLSVKYTPKWGDGKLSFGIDVFNVLNSLKITEIDEVHDDDDGSTLETFGTARAYQTPRYARFSASVDF
ncbi:MAG TPA: TonB-dependent receptor [Opitutaceae bacterium]